MIHSRLPVYQPACTSQYHFPTRLLTVPSVESTIARLFLACRESGTYCQSTAFGNGGWSRSGCTSPAHTQLLVPLVRDFDSQGPFRVRQSGVVLQHLAERC